ncbi:hypothetical protein L227DRAFT_395189 [Lentinus tigrinus ALCF2SS1-6]|uniref:Uncharacterized protein n=1 Tax=Lentinus tigrinus ALCF2SS1-6 TaxID=1328759 RepID=A0A5C2RPT3_9APHY|nr:hypothetical protein L227DRAFT_395189 [Lentinus tigrinus ALCF2SS1-6]
MSLEFLRAMYVWRRNSESLVFCCVRSLSVRPHAHVHPVVDLRDLVVCICTSTCRYRYSDCTFAGGTVEQSESRVHCFIMLLYVMIAKAPYIHSATMHLRRDETRRDGCRYVHKYGERRAGGTGGWTVSRCMCVGGSGETYDEARYREVRVVRVKTKNTGTMDRGAATTMCDVRWVHV